MGFPNYSNGSGANAVVSALRLSFNLGYHYELFRCVYPSPSLDTPVLTQLKWALSFEGDFLLLVTLALVFSAVGLWARRVPGFLISLISLVCLGTVYAMWYAATVTNMHLFGAKHFSEMANQQQYLLPLLGATWGDIVVLAVALIVLIWHVAMLKRVLKPLVVKSEDQPNASPS